MDFRKIALSLIMLPLLGGVSASVLEKGNSGGQSGNSDYRASGNRFRYPARDYSEQSDGKPGGTLKASVVFESPQHQYTRRLADAVSRIETRSNAVL